MLGCHTIKHWSSTQTSVALSSGEAEFAGVIRGAGQALGYQALLRDLGVEAPIRVWTDSSAAIGICTRQGLGKLRHLDTHTLWIQQAVRLGRIDLRKVAGEVNPADLLTKHSLSKDRMEKLVALHGCRYIGGRAESAPLTRTGVSDKATMASHGSGSSVAAVNGNVNDQSSAEGLGIDGSGRSGMVAEGDPIMPHLTHDKTQLDRDYPSIMPPPDEELRDLTTDECDTVYQAGLRAAEDIRRSMQVLGRRRRIAESAEAAKPNDAGARSAKATGSRPPTSPPRRLPHVPPTYNAAPSAGPPVADDPKEDNFDIKLLEYTLNVSEGATPNSSSCRRRSVRISGSPGVFQRDASERATDRCSSSVRCGGHLAPAQVQ